MTDALVARLRAAGCVFAEEEAALLRSTAGTPADLEALLARRLSGEPLEHVLGWVELEGVRLAVGPGVFVPRQRTRVLIGAVLDLIADDVAPVVVELCCGVAPVATIVARARPDATVWASDIDPAAAALAGRNLDPTRVVLGDLFDGLPDRLRQGIDVVVANAPYVPTDELALMPVEAREHEPRHALDGGADGLALHRRIAAQASAWLRPAGAVVIETSRRQASATSAALADAGMRTTTRRDEEIDGTAVIGVLPRGGRPARPARPRPIGPPPTVVPVKTTRTFRYLTVAAAAALSLTLASCSGSDETNDSSTAEETTASEQTGDAETTEAEDETTDGEATEDEGDAAAPTGAECLVGTWEVTPEALEESILAAYGGEGEAEAEGVSTITFDGTVYTMNADSTVSFSVDMDGTPLEGTTVTKGEFVIAYTADDTTVTFGEVKSADGSVTVDVGGQSQETDLSDTAGTMAGVAQDYTCTDTELTVVTELGDTQIEQTYTRS